MLVEEVLELARVRLKNLSASKIDKTLITILNLGVNDLYRRFNLRVKSETILVNTDIAAYELRNDDVNMLLALYNRDGMELKQSDTVDDASYDYKIVNYRGFVLRHLFDGYVYAIYKASPIKLVDVKDYIDLPDAMIPALVTYICSQIEHTVNVWDRGQVKSEPSYYWQLYEKECQELVNQGYLVSLSTESLAVQVRGFI